MFRRMENQNTREYQRERRISCDVIQIMQVFEITTHIKLLVTQCSNQIRRLSVMEIVLVFFPPCSRLLSFIHTFD